MKQMDYTNIVCPEKVDESSPIQGLAQISHIIKVSRLAEAPTWDTPTLI